MSKKLISFIIPSYNEASNIEELYRRLIQSLEKLSYDFEFVFVDDGSEDGTVETLASLRARDPRVKYISLSRNFGHQNALTAGLDHVSGDAVVSMDSDLQHPPELVPELVRWWEKGYDIVYTYRKSMEDASLLKRITARFFYGLMNAASQVQIDPNTSDFRLIDKRVAHALGALKEHERFYRGLIKWVGFNQKRVDFDAQPRFSGTGKYTFSKMLRLAAYGFLSYSHLPLYSVIFLCFLFIVLSCVYGAFALYQKFAAHIAIPGQMSVLLTILVVASVQLYAFAIISIYVLKGFHESRKRPVYIIKEKKGLDDQ